MVSVFVTLLLLFIHYLYIFVKPPVGISSTSITITTKKALTGGNIGRAMSELDYLNLFNSVRFKSIESRGSIRQPLCRFIEFN